MTVLSPAKSLLGALRSLRTLVDNYPGATDSAPSLIDLKEALGRSIDELTEATSVELDGNGMHSEQ